MNWTRIASKLVSLGAIALSMSFMMSCGPDGIDSDEVAYVYVFNAYAGSKSMSLYGPSGKVITDLGYGQRSEDPIAVDRNLGTSFKLIVDGAPKTIEQEFTLFDLYPHETGTLLFKKRDGLSSANALIYRHVQSISKEQCRIVFDNALSLENESLGYFGFVPLFKLPTAADADYRRGESLNRDSVMDRIDSDPRFVFVPHFEFPENLMLVHAGKGTRIDYRTGSVLTDRPTEEYELCLLEADGDPMAMAMCKRQKVYTTHVYQPTSEEQHFIEYPKGFLDPAAPNSCNVTATIESDFSNIFRENKLITASQFKFTPGNHMFWILYGRPVDPDILAFSTDSDGGHSMPLPPYPGQ